MTRKNQKKKKSNDHYTFHVLPKSKDLSISIADGRKVLNVIIRCVKWNSASKSRRILLSSFPFSLCHHDLRLVLEDDNPGKQLCT